MKSIVSLMTKRELPKRTENQVTQSSRDVKNFEDIVKDFKISARKMKEFYMKQDCFSSTYFSSTYYKPIRGTTKRGEGNQILQFQWGGGTQFLTQIWWIEIFWRKLWLIFGRISTKYIYKLCLNKIILRLL